MDRITGRGYSICSNQRQDTMTGRRPRDIYPKESLQQQQSQVIAPERATARGLLLTLLLAAGIFAVAAGSARFLFPRGSKGRVPATDVSVNALVSRTGGQAAQGKSSRQTKPKLLRSPTGPSWKSTKDCASRTDLLC